MTVQQLIDKLSKVKDRTQLVFVYQNNFEGEWESVTCTNYEYQDEEEETKEGFYIS